MVPEGEPAMMECRRDSRSRKPRNSHLESQAGNREHTGNGMKP